MVKLLSANIYVVKILKGPPEGGPFFIEKSETRLPGFRFRICVKIQFIV